MKVSLIATVLNEESTIGGLLESIIAQQRLPDEVVIADGGSTDHTLEIVNSYAKKLPLKIIVKLGCNISQGRNLAIEAASGEVIASTDAGVRLTPNWLSDLVKPLEESIADVACGFFVADPKTTFEVAMGATVLPDVEEIRPATFLPSSRSVAFTKEAWRAVGGYPEWLDYCEDLILDFNLRRAGYRFAWAPSAIVYFRPRSDLCAFFRQYYRYARGDGKANLWLKRHISRYASYLFLAPLAIASGFWFWPLWILPLLGAAIYLYRPYKRLLPKLRGLLLREKILAVLYVPIIRVTGDVAKMVGYPVGVRWRVSRG